jgi:sRNA-binding regulator protein Hfq
MEFRIEQRPQRLTTLLVNGFSQQAAVHLVQRSVDALKSSHHQHLIFVLQGYD